MAMSPGTKKWLLIGGVGVAGVVVLVLVAGRGSSSASAPASQSPSGTTSGGTAAVGIGSLANFENGISAQVGTLAQAVSALQSSAASASKTRGKTTSPPGPAPSAPAPASRPGYGPISIGGKSYDVIGTINSGGTYNGYEVGGGAPVYFGSVNGIAQGLSNVKAGNYAYVPAAYGSWISKTAIAKNQKIG